MAESLTDKIRLSKRDTGDLNWGQGANANLDALDAHVQQATLRPPRTLLATLGSGAVGANLLGSTSYLYKITAVNAAGETTEGKIPAMVEAQVTEPASPLPVILQWETVKGATGYKIYKSTTSGQEKFLASVSGEATAVYTDDGNTAVNGALSVPAANTARAAVSKIVAGTNVTISPPDGTGDVTINAAGGTVPDASDTVKGIAKLSVAPAVPTNPVAVGDNDPRNADARTPAGAAGGDLGGTYPNPGVAKVNGVSVPASPSAGQVLTATSPTASAWQTPAGGGGYATVVVAAPTGVAATDTANIQNAINGIGSGTVILREGLYVVNATIALKDRLTIRGQGKGEYGSGAPTTIKCDNAMGDVPLFDDGASPKKDVSLEDFSIDFNGFSRAARSGNYDIRILGVRSRLLRIALANTSGINTPILVQCNNITEFDSPLLTECIFIQGKVCGNQPFSITGKVTNCTFIGNTATGGFQSGLAHFGQPSVVTGCVFRTSIDYTTGVSGSTVSCNTAVSNGRAGTAITGCMFIQESGSATRAIQVENDGTGAVAVAGNFSATGTNVGSVSVRNGGGSGKVTISANAGFASYSGGTLSGNDGQTPVNSGDAAGGDLSGTYPNPTVVDVDGATGTLSAKQKVEVQKAGVAQGTRPAVNLIEGSGIALTVADDSANNRVNVTVAASGGASGYATVVAPAATGVEATDTTNLQAALDAVDTLKGGEVVLREGTYLCGQLIIRRHGLKLRGLNGNMIGNSLSAGGSKIRFNVSTQDGLLVQADHVTIEGVGFQMTNVSGGFACILAGANFASGGRSLVIKNCSFVEIRQSSVGLRVSGLERLVVDQCMFEFNNPFGNSSSYTALGIKVESGGVTTRNGVVSDCVFWDKNANPPSGGAVITVKFIVLDGGGERYKISGCHGRGYAGGSTVEPSTFIEVRDVGNWVCSDNQFDQLNQFIKDISTGIPANVTVNGNVCYQSSAPSPAGLIDLISARYWSIVGNLMFSGVKSVRLQIGTVSNIVLGNALGSAVDNTGSGNVVVNNT